MNAPYFITLDEAAMEQLPDVLNQVSLAVLRRVAGDPPSCRSHFFLRPLIWSCTAGLTVSGV
jgi:hypothetical protein